jgi:NTE family protein
MMFGIIGRGNPAETETAASEQSDIPPVEAGLRNRMGIALGGGAARGWSHIGILRALDEAGLSPGIVAGTSIGAVVGGCYLAGILDNLEAFARSLTRRRVFGLLDINFSGSGLISGNRLSKLLRTELGDRRIEDLDRRFVCVATELATGHEIWMGRGNLVEAIRASYALPGVFQPVMVGGRWLVDGALVNPIPVSVCRAVGANIVVAVNLASDLFGRGTVVQDHSADPIASQVIDKATAGGIVSGEDARQILRRQLLGGANGPPGIPSVMVEAYNIIQDRIARSRLAGDPPDVTINPKLGRIGLFEFHRAAEAIDAGYDIARRMIPEIKDIIAELTPT